MRARGIRTALDGRLPPERVAGEFQRKGWLVNPRGLHLCPGCQQARASERAERRAAQAAKTMEIDSMPAKTSPQPAPLKPTPAAVQKNRDVLAGFELYFDLEKGRYRLGWNDELLAREVGVSAVYVAAKREEFCGPIQEDGVLAEMESLHAMLQAHARGCLAIRDKVKELPAALAAFGLHVEVALAGLEELGKHAGEIGSSVQALADRYRAREERA